MQFPQQMIPSYSICVPLRRLIFFSLSIYIYLFFPFNTFIRMLPFGMVLPNPIPSLEGA